MKLEAQMQAVIDKAVVCARSGDVRQRVGVDRYRSVPCALCVGEWYYYNAADLALHDCISLDWRPEAWGKAHAARVRVQHDVRHLIDHADIDALARAAAALRGESVPGDVAALITEYHAVTAPALAHAEDRAAQAEAAAKHQAALARSADEARVAAERKRDEWQRRVESAERAAKGAYEQRDAMTLRAHDAERRLAEIDNAKHARDSDAELGRAVTVLMAHARELMREVTS